MTWEMVPLGEILELRYGRALKAEDRSNSGFPVIGSGGVTGHHATPFVTGPTIVVGRKGSIGSLTYAPDGCWPIDTAYFVQLKQEVNLRWLYWSMQVLHLDSMNKSAAVPGLNRDDAYRARLPLPPLPEQRRIAAILDEADILRVKRSKSVALLDELPSVRFSGRQTTHWRQTTVGDVADLQGGLTVNARRASLPTVAAYLRVANVFRGSIDLGTLKEIGVSDAELSRTRLKRGDVLVVEGHGNLAEIGRAAMIDHLPKEPLTHQNHLFRLRARGGAVTGRFLELAINSPSSRENLKRVANTTSGLNTLNATSIRNLPILVAPLDEQHEIEAEFAVAAAARRLAQRERQDLDSLFASLQHRAFRGAL